MRQIRIAPNGLWHRAARGDPKHTACGAVIPGAYSSRESSRAENHLCPVCWTKHELDTGEMAKLERDVMREHEAHEHGHDRDTPTEITAVDPTTLDE